jgi:NAD(P)-dependent dehydrogenase (short-subunit alcohol dehydrogenase family)
MADFAGKVAIVTGAGNGIGRAHALGLAARGARVVVNDLAGRSGVSEAAQAVVEQINRSGRQASADGADVSKPDEVGAMVTRAHLQYGRVDILVNNAGILRDRSFAKSTLADFQKIFDVHVMGAVNCCQAVWPLMREQNYGRIVMTISASGLYGNFGQANYGAAKMALVGLMNVLSIEGAKNDIRVNALCPVAATGMMKGLVPDVAFELITPEAITPALLFLAGEEAPSRMIMSAGGGGFALVRVEETHGIYLPESERTPENVAARFAQIADRSTAQEHHSSSGQGNKFMEMAAQAHGVYLKAV